MDVGASVIQTFSQKKTNYNRKGGVPTSHTNMVPLLVTAAFWCLLQETSTTSVSGVGKGIATGTEIPLPQHHTRDCGFSCNTGDSISDFISINTNHAYIHILSLRSAALNTLAHRA